MYCSDDVILCYSLKMVLNSLICALTLELMIQLVNVLMDRHMHSFVVEMNTNKTNDMFNLSF